MGTGDEATIGGRGGGGRTSTSRTRDALRRQQGRLCAHRQHLQTRRHTNSRYLARALSLLSLSFPPIPSHPTPPTDQQEASTLPSFAFVTFNSFPRLPLLPNLPFLEPTSPLLEILERLLKCSAAERVLPIPRDQDWATWVDLPEGVAGIGGAGSRGELQTALERFLG